MHEFGHQGYWYLHIVSYIYTMLSSSPKSLIKKFAPPSKQQTASPRQLMKHYPKGSVDSSPSSGKAKSHRRQKQNKDDDPKSMIKSYAASSTTNSINMMSEEDSEFCRHSHHNLLQHPTLKDFYPKIVDGTFCLELSATAVATVDNHAVIIEEAFQYNDDSSIQTLRENGTSSVTSALHHGILEQNKEQQQQEGRKRKQKIPQNNPLTTTSSLPSPVPPPASTSSTLSTTSQLFEESMHQALIQHESLRDCSPQIMQNIFSLRVSSTAHRWKEFSPADGSGYDDVIRTTVDPITIAPVDVSMTEPERQVMHQYMNTCVMVEAAVTALCVTVFVLIVISLLILCVLLMEGYIGVRVSQDMEQVLPFVSVDNFRRKFVLLGAAITS